MTAPAGTGSIEVARPGQLRGRLSVPGDKSITHRAVLLNTLAKGQAVVRGAGLGGDCLSTIGAIRALGASVQIEGSTVRLASPGWAELKEPGGPIDCGNSGTTMRLLLGLLAGTDFFTVITGDGSLSNRPMGRVAEPLRQLGAQIYGRAGSTRAPLAVVGRRLQGRDLDVAVASAQVKSALLIAGLAAAGQTMIRQPARSRDHTERMLAAMGAAVEVDGATVSIDGASELSPIDITVPGDFSSAAFWLVLGCVHPDAHLSIANVGLNPTRAAALEVLRRMGARIEMTPADGHAEPAGDLTVGSSDLLGAEIAGAEVPLLMDELPVLAVAATQARGRTVISDAAELRVKESDRIEATVVNLRAMGANIVAAADGMVIEGPTPLHGAVVDSFGDHRVAMAMAVAASVATGESSIRGAESVAISYPDFFPTLRRLAVG